MAECLDDLNLPNTIIARLIKDALPQGVSVTAEAKSAIARAASVFVLYLTNMSNSKARQESRKRIIPKDIFDTLTEADFTEFVAPLKESFESMCYGFCLFCFASFGFYLCSVDYLLKLQSTNKRRIQKRHRKKIV